MARPRTKAPVVKNYAPDLQDEICKRIGDCESVLRHLGTCPAWKVIIEDLSRQKQYIDDNWQNLEKEDPKLQELRVAKLAYFHLINLKDKYALDLEMAQKELDKLRNTDTQIIRDYDVSTGVKKDA